MTDKEVNHSSRGEDSPPPEESLEPARTELRRAYMQMGFGQFDEALESCARAERLLGEHYLPATLRAAVLSARGQHAEAIRALKRIRDNHPEQALPHLYFAEACFFSGRTRQAERALACADDCEKSQDEEAFLERLRAVWEQVEPADVPPPLEPEM